MSRSIVITLPTSFEEIFFVTRIPGPCNGSSVFIGSWETLPLCDDLPMYVRTPVDHGDGPVNELSRELTRLLQTDREVRPFCWFGDWCFEAL